MKYIHVCTVCDWPWLTDKKEDDRPCGNCGGETKRLTPKQQEAYMAEVKGWKEKLKTILEE